MSDDDRSAWEPPTVRGKGGLTAALVADLKARPTLAQIQPPTPTPALGPMQVLVLDRNNKPVSGAMVAIYPHTAQGNQTVAEWKTNDQGRVSIDPGLPPGTPIDIVAVLPDGTRDIRQAKAGDPNVEVIWSSYLTPEPAIRIYEAAGFTAGTGLGVVGLVIDQPLLLAFGASLAAASVFSAFSRSAR